MRVSWLMVVAMTITWMLVFGEFSLSQALLGLAFGVAFVLMTGAGHRRVVPLAKLPGHLLYLAVYLLVLIPYDIVISNLDMARRIARPRPAIRPGIVRFQLESASDATAGLVAHAITMSPGQMVVDYSDDSRTIYVHLLDVVEAEAKEISFWRLYYRLLKRVSA